MNQHPDDIAEDVTQFAAVTAESVASASISYSESRLSEDTLYWLERRPDQGGRCTIMRYQDGSTAELLPSRFNCRSRVHEYGGGAYTVSSGTVFFINDDDQQVYRLHGDEVSRITDQPGLRFSDLDFDCEHSRLFAVCEDHRKDGLPENTVVSIRVDDGQLKHIASQHDFFSSPRYHAGKLAWLAWDFPDMPWDASCLYVSELDDSGDVVNTSFIAGGEDCSVQQPRWHDGILYYISDKTGWWNIYRNSDGEDRNLFDIQAEIGEPHWVFGQSSYCFVDDRLIASVNRGHTNELFEIDLATAHHRQIHLPQDNLHYLSGSGSLCCMIAASPNQLPHVLLLDGGTAHEITQDSSPGSSCAVTQAQALRMQSRNGYDIHALYYAPVNQVDDRLPPMIVIGHGGPTGQSDTSLDLRKQYWTSRGYALLDVNYSGSTGYGRAYRERLYGEWGIMDVRDICDAALAACDAGKADPERLIIKGSSAGGYTVLAALTFEDVFTAGASYYGISDLETLALDTHKFEARYLDKLVGPYPDMIDIYRQRSPIHHTAGLNCPVLFLQGDEDRVVPREQAESMIDVLDSKGIPVAYRLYAGEQHGFRQASTIIDALESEYCFYSKIFGEQRECDLEIKNLDQ